MNSVSRRFIQIASLLGALGVGLGAFGAHALEEMLVESERLDTYQTAVLYQFIHLLAILAVALVYNHKENNLIKLSGYGFILGIIIFSGSLYILCLTDITWLGAITPIGGVFFIISWILLALGISKR